MKQTLLEYIFERLNQQKSPIKLKRLQIKDYFQSELDQLLSRGIVRNLSPSFPAVSIRSASSPENKYKANFEPEFEVDIQRLVEVLCEENKIEGSRCEYKGGIISLGWKKQGVNQPFVVYFSLWTDSETGVISLADRVKLGEDCAVAILLLRSILLSAEAVKKLRSWNAGILSLNEICRADHWLLPWEDILSVPKVGFQPTLSIKRPTQQVFYKKLEISLTPIEFKYILCLAEKTRQLVPTLVIAREVVGLDDFDKEINYVSWAKTHKYNIMKKLRTLIGQADITKVEIEDFITAGRGCYGLAIPASEIVITD
jgi:hypothetical protein